MFFKSPFKSTYSFSISNRFRQFGPQAPSTYNRNLEVQQPDQLRQNARNKLKQANPTYFPLQHPQQLESDDSSLLRFDQPVKFLTPLMEVPAELFKSQAEEAFQESPPNSKKLDVALVGPPNAGQSSLLNHLIGRKISAVSNQSHTTFEKRTGIYTDIEKHTQLVIHDTPGIVQRYKGSRKIASKSWDVLGQCDKAVFMVDAVRSLDDSVRQALQRLSNLKYDQKGRNIIEKYIGQENNQQEIIQMIEENQRAKTIAKRDSERLPKVLVLNQIDLCTNKKQLNYILNEIQDLGKFDQIFKISCETGFGVEELQKYLISESRTGKWAYSPKVQTTLSDADIAEELVGMEIFNRFFQEIPFGCLVQLAEYVTKSDGVIRVTFDVITSRKEQCAIIIGEGGRNLKIISEKTRRNLIEYFQKEFEVHFNIISENQQLKGTQLYQETIFQKGYGTRKITEQSQNYQKNKQLILNDVSET